MAAAGALADENAIAGAFSVNILDNETKAYVTGSSSSLLADGSVKVTAQDDVEIISIGGSIALQGLGGMFSQGDGFSLGLANSTTITSNEVKAYIDNNVVVQANGNQAAINIFTGEVDDNGNKTTEKQRGVLVAAVSYDDIITISGTLSRSMSGIHETF